MYETSSKVIFFREYDQSHEIRSKAITCDPFEVHFLRKGVKGLAQVPAIQ